jgi:hypothetical protein
LFRLAPEELYCKRFCKRSYVHLLSDDLPESPFGAPVGNAEGNRRARADTGARIKQLADDEG